MVLLTAPWPLPSVAPHPRQCWPPDPPGCAQCPVFSPRPVLSPSAASGHLAFRPRSAGCSSQMRLACLQKQVPTRCHHPQALRSPSCSGEPPGPSLVSATPSPTPIELGASQGQVREDEGCAQLHRHASSSLSSALLESARGGGQQRETNRIKDPSLLCIPRQFSSKPPGRSKEEVHLAPSPPFKPLSGADQGGQAWGVSRLRTTQLHSVYLHSPGPLGIKQQGLARPCASLPLSWSEKEEKDPGQPPSPNPAGVPVPSPQEVCRGL